jgi:hypothetical protein
MGGPNGTKAREAMMLAAPETTAVGAMNATFDPATWKGHVLNGPVPRAVCQQIRPEQPRLYEGALSEPRITRDRRHRAIS